MQREFAGRVKELRIRLDEALRRQAEREVDRSLQLIRDAAAPFDRFVRAERDKAAEDAAALRALKSEFAGLRADIAEALPSEDP